MPEVPYLVHYVLPNQVIRIDFLAETNIPPDMLIVARLRRQCVPYMLLMWHTPKDVVLTAEFTLSPTFYTDHAAADLFRSDLDALSKELRIPSLRRLDLWWVVHTSNALFTHPN